MGVPPQKLNWRTFKKGLKMTHTYHQKGSVAGLAAGIANAQSFVSCAIGRMTWVFQVAGLQDHGADMIEKHNGLP